MIVLYVNDSSSQRLMKAKPKWINSNKSDDVKNNTAQTPLHGYIFSMLLLSVCIFLFLFTLVDNRQKYFSLATSWMRSILNFSFYSYFMHSHTKNKKIFHWSFCSIHIKNAILVFEPFSILFFCVWLLLLYSFTHSPVNPFTNEQFYTLK